MILIIHEDGSMSATTKEPSKDDLAAIDDGILELVKFDGSNFQFLQPDGSWQVIKE